MSLAVVTTAELEALAERVRRLERERALAAPSGWLRGAECPGGARRMRRLREAGVITGYRLANQGRTWFFKVADVAALMSPAPAVVRDEPTSAEPCTSADYAERNLRLLVGRGRAA